MRASRRETNPEALAGTRRRLLASALGFALVGVGHVTGALAGPGAPAPARRERRPTLEPALFVGRAAAAHRVAREIPDVLDRLYCYCRCDKQLGHVSLLSCYTDGHAAT